LSPEAKDHFTRVESIASVALKDLADVAAEIEQLREEIMMRAKMTGKRPYGWMSCGARLHKATERSGTLLT
jgi:hypothetical protein